MPANKEDDQLLQDASTLLMFANVAAKQLHQSAPAPAAPAPTLHIHQQHPHALPHLLHSDGSYTAQSPAMQINNMILPHHPQPLSDQPPPHIALHPGTMYQRIRPLLHQIPHGSLPSHGQAPHQHLQSLPSAFQHPHHLPMSQRLPPAKSYDQDLHQAQAYAHANRYIPSEQYAPMDLQQAPRLGTLTHRPIPFTAAHPQLPPPMSSQVSSRRSSHSSIPHILNSEGSTNTGVASSKILMASLLEPPMPSAPNDMQRSESRSSQTRLISPPSVQDMRDSDLPPLSHRRSVSNPHLDYSLARNNAKNLAKFSPMQGININTQVRNNSNAMIAAAALAAAAEVPLPLRTKSPDQVLGGPLEVDVKSTTKSTSSKTTTGGKRKSNKTPSLTPKTPSEPENPAPSAVKPEPVQSPPVDVKPEVVEPQIPSLDSYKVDPDSGAIGCICEIPDDDGYTIQCDVCFRWQHCLCMGFKTSEEVPEDEYKCYYCDKKKWGRIDAAKCKADTLTRLNRDKMEKKAKEGAQTNLKRKALASDKPERKRRADNGFATAQDKAQEPQQPSGSELETTVTDKLPNIDNELLRDGVTAEAYESVYFRTKMNDYKTPATKLKFEAWGHLFRELYDKLPKAEQKKPLGGIEVMSLAQFKALKLSRVVLPNHAKYLESQKTNAAKKNKFNKTAIHVGSYSDNQKQKFSGFSKLALFLTSDAGDTAEIPTGTTVIEYVGELDTFLNYVADRANQYSLWGTTKPRVVDSHLQVGGTSVDIVLDSRFVGNESRFIRKACPNASNCTLKVVYIPESNSFKFLVVTTRPIAVLPSNTEEELRLDWKWDPSHPIQKVSEAGQCKFDQLEDPEKAVLISCIDNILHFTECGCSTSTANLSCSIFKVKKATSYLLRSTRKASGISTVNLMRPKDELVRVPRKEPFISWDERLLQRAKSIELRLSVSAQEVNDLDESDNAYLAKDGTAHGKARLLVYFKVPFRKQLSAPHNALISPESETAEISFSPDQNLELPFMVMPEVSRKIDDMIDSQLLPVVKEEVSAPKPGSLLSASPISATDTNPGTSPATQVLDGASKILITSASSPETKETSVSSISPSAEPPKPSSPVVKKLSFADYKKKKM